MRDKKYIRRDEIFVTVENRSAGLGSYELVLISFGLIFVLRVLTAALRLGGKTKENEHQDKSDYIDNILDIVADLVGHAITPALSLFSFTIAFMHFRRILDSSD